MAPKKRTSGGASAAGAKKAKGAPPDLAAAIPPDAKHLPHMSLFDDWVFFGYKRSRPTNSENTQKALRLDNLKSKATTIDVFLAEKLAKEAA